ncbi:adenosine kinase [Cyberlindnera jadinii NRRL Y-1542]|uniref:Adenosine kinase n=1 Tax=Cyberlindnera jadinii (strain ATCC 18201 / CBS 1600 / BCRC 20928 / JCM 3617 / NBRC 0987 / NRRL Y-1542) TaxID=983966 RepID=A0A1E4RZP5_CYBJN|nr:adenosine kinase [Cyberlindnera jadinii NRRL Y-1542]ODV72645.1 adenosine kinase [Cyberlindnera jadinii NRRL Y-1542]
MSFPLVALGNPLLDLQVDTDAAYLEKYGLKANDAILVEEKHMPIFKEVVENPNKHIVAGGAAQNAARGAQYLLPENSVVYFGSVGKDKYSELLLEANAKAGVKTLYQFQDKYETGKCAALITGHNRSLATDLAAANHFTPDHLQKPENWEYVEKAKFFYIGGFHLTVSPDAIYLLGQHAADTNKDFSLNLSAPFIPEFFKDVLDKSISFANYVIGNETEAAAYAKSHGLETEDLTEIAKYIAKEPRVNEKKNRTVIITHGLEPTITVTYDAASGNFDVKEIPVHALASENIKDTNGAGDAFAGGLLAGLVSGDSLEKAVDKGQWLAKLSIQEVGPSFPYPRQAYSA